MFPLWLATVIIFCFLSGYWLWKVINSFFYYDKKKKHPCVVEPLKSPPSTPLSCPSSAASLSQGPPTPSIHPVSPSFAINLPSPALSVCFPLIQDGFDALSPSLGLKLSVDTGPSPALSCFRGMFTFGPKQRRAENKASLLSCPFGCTARCWAEILATKLDSSPQLGYLLRYWWTGRICLLCSARQEMFNE